MQIYELFYHYRAIYHRNSLLDDYPTVVFF